MFERNPDSEPDGRRDRLRFWLTIGVATVLAGVVAALVLLLARANGDYDRSLGWQAHSLEVIQQTRSLDASLAKAEAALGRFAVSLQKGDGRVFEQQWGLARQYLSQLQRNVRDNPKQAVLVNALTKELDQRRVQLGDAALSANYNQTVAAISKYHAAGHDAALGRIDKLLAQIIRNERTLLTERNRIAASDRDSLNQAILLFSLLGAIAAVIAIAATFSLIRADGERRLARREQHAESDRATQLEEAVNARTAQLAEANIALRNEMNERETAEAQLRQAQKMEAVGQLTGGIAHDFNNMLAVVVGGLELASRWLVEAPDKAQRHLGNALDGANRAADLTRRLLTFARSEPARPEMTHVDDCITSFAELIERTIGDRIALTLDLNAANLSCWLDRQQFENALLNLAVNARDAMDGHGTLTIRTLRDGAGDKGLAVEVIDSGCGMAPDVLERVFDPFYTTKPAGLGTGLGMSQVFAFCRQSEGEVQISSAEGTGTRVAMLLPVASRPPVAETGQMQAEPNRFADSAGEALKILVVEDDLRVLAATVDAVDELGHQAVACANPLAAETLVESHGDFDLILSDVLMPELTGPELVARLKERWPDLAVLFVTGYSGDASEVASFGDHDVLRKPFTLTALDQAIRRSACSDPAVRIAAFG